MNALRLMILPLAVMLFSVFPLTDTDIWWHLACAREWVVTWTPVRGNIVNVHEFFQQVVSFVYTLGGAPLLVAFKALLWGTVFLLFLLPLRRKTFGLVPVAVLAAALFCFRFHFELRPVVFSMLFLGIYWNLVPRIFDREGFRKIPIVLLLLCLQWLWCRFQGLYILGPVLVAVFAAGEFVRKNHGGKGLALLVLLFLAMPFLHRDGLKLFLYPFGLLDRLMGLTESAVVFAGGIAEIRSPLTLLMEGENVLADILAILFAVVSLALAVRGIAKSPRRTEPTTAWLCITAVLALAAERNIVLFLPAMCYFVLNLERPLNMPCHARRLGMYLPVVLLFAVLGVWCRSLLPYDRTMVSSLRVPVAAAQWMKSNPHEGRLFNDDRAGGYLAFENPGDSTYMDGRFILKSAEFFGRYLEYPEKPETYMHDVDSLGVDRAIFPLRYYARWDGVISAMLRSGKWGAVYVDSGFVVLDRKNLR